MVCLIVSDQIRVQMDNCDMAVPASDILSYSPTQATTMPRSALQYPDMSRMRLAAMLRRKAAAAPASRLSWSSMLNGRIANCANANNG